MAGHPMPKKNAQLLKLEGTYRRDRHAYRDEERVTTLMPSPPLCPPSITDESVRQSWVEVISALAYTNRLAREDIEVLEQAFKQLQIARQLWEEYNSKKSNKERAPIQRRLEKAQRFYVSVMSRYGASSQDRLMLLGMMQGAQIRQKSLIERMTEEEDDERAD